jgi:DNA-binding NarL/FixJ family response regulator
VTAAESDVSRSIRVIVCDDVPEMRAILRDALTEDDSVEIVSETDNGRDSVRAIRELQPDVVVLDLSMPDMDGLEAIPLIAKTAPQTGIIIFSGFAADRMQDVAIGLGADRYLEKGAPLGLLFNAVREVVAQRRRGNHGGHEPPGPL